MRLIVEYYRENPPGQAHGAVHAEVHEWKKPRPRVTLCGLSTRVDMRKLSTPFEGFQEVMCPACSALMEI